MAKLKVRVTTTREVDTDLFTLEEWKSFIKEHLSGEEIARVARDSTNLFPLETLKERALLIARLRQDVGDLL